LGQADAPQEGGLAALVCAGDDHEVPPVRVRIVADDLLLLDQGQADIVETGESMPALLGRQGHGEAGRAAPLCQLLMQVQAADIERQLDSEHLEEAVDVIGRLSYGIRHQVQAPVFQVCQRAAAVFVARMDAESVDRAARGQDALQPVPIRVIRLAQDIAGPFIALAQPGAHQDAAAEPQRLEVCLDAGKVLVVKLLLDHAEEAAEAFGLELSGIFVGNLFEPAEQLDIHLQQVDGAGEDAAGMAAKDAQPPVMLLPVRLHRNCINLPDHRSMLQAVFDDSLSV